MCRTHTGLYLKNCVKTNQVSVTRKWCTKGVTSDIGEVRPCTMPRPRGTKERQDKPKHDSRSRTGPVKVDQVQSSRVDGGTKKGEVKRVPTISESKGRVTSPIPGDLLFGKSSETDIIILLVRPTRSLL